MSTATKGDTRTFTPLGSDIMNTVSQIGRGWPNPDEPGVPAFPLEHGFHWMRWRDGSTQIGEWSPDIWLWVVCYRGEMSAPDEMAHLDYIQPADVPIAARPAYWPNARPPRNGPPP